MGKETKITIPLGGQWSSGAAADIPDGYCRKVQNYVFRPNRLEPRPPFVYDAIMNVNGLANFEDSVNGVTRMVALTGPNTTYQKATSGETWTAVSGLSNGSIVAGHITFGGVLYLALEGSGVPQRITAFNGTTVDPEIFPDRLRARAIASFQDRVFLLSPSVTVTNLIATAANAAAYGASGWTGTNATMTTITSGSAVLTRLTPTNATTSRFTGPSITVTASNTDTYYVFSADIRNTSQSSSIPMKIDLFLATTWAAGFTYLAGEVVRPTTANGLRYRVTTAGTAHAVTEPTWPTDVGATVVDNTITWTCDGPDTFGRSEFFLLNANDDPDFQRYFVRGIVPPIPVNTLIQPRIHYGNSSSGFTRIAIDIGRRDGLVAGDPRKNNKGLQVTSGNFVYPFFNVETGSANPIELHGDLLWSEIADAKLYRSENFYRLSDTPGYGTALVTAGGRIIAAKQRAIWIFQGSPDPDNPIVFERLIENVGILGSTAVDVMDGMVYFLSENTVQRMSPDGDLTDIAGDAMREQIMERGATWYENISSSGRPFVRANPRTREVYVFTQGGLIFVYNVDRQLWSQLTYSDNDGQTRYVSDMLFNPNTGKMYVALDPFHGVLRLDNTSAAEDTIDNTATTYDVPLEIVTRPIEVSGPRYDSTIDVVGVHHMATASQSGETTEVAISFDGGVTFPRSNIVRFATVSSGGKDRIPVPVWQAAASLTIKIKHLAKAGSGVFPLSRLDAELIVDGEEFPRTTPTQVSNTLTS